MSVEQRLRERMRTEGPLPFAVFMEEALYGEGGYYARAEIPIGEDGDFVTGASHSPLFAAATGRLVERLDDVLGHPADYLEVGYGNGDHVATLVSTLPEPRKRRILAWDRVERPLPVGIERPAALSELGERELDGVIFSYELFDALPVHRLVGGANELEELWVELDDGGAFVWRRGPLSDPALAELPGRMLAPGQIADLSAAWRPLYRRLARLLGRGVLVTCDYGFESDKLLDPRVRRHGTLACFRRQRVHRDALSAVGEQDLTAHIDFGALTAEGEAAGLETLAFTRLAPWLAELGLLEELASAAPAARLRAMQLMDLEGMGEEIRVLVQGRGVDREFFSRLPVS